MHTHRGRGKWLIDSGLLLEVIWLTQSKPLLWVLVVCSWSVFVSVVAPGLRKKKKKKRKKECLNRELKLKMSNESAGFPTLCELPFTAFYPTAGCLTRRLHVQMCVCLWYTGIKACLCCVHDSTSVHLCPVGNVYVCVCLRAWKGPLSPSLLRKITQKGPLCFNFSALRVALPFPASSTSVWLIMMKQKHQEC